MALNPRQQRFVAEYIRLENATEAYAIAYNCENRTTAATNGGRLLRNAEIKAAIDDARREAFRRIGLTAEGWAEEVEALAHSDIGDILDFTGEFVKLRPADQIGRRGRRAISGIKVRRYVEGRGAGARTVEVVEFKLWSKPDGLKQEGQHLGLLKDRLEVTGADGGPLNTRHEYSITAADLAAAAAIAAAAGAGVPPDHRPQPLDPQVGGGGQGVLPAPAQAAPAPHAR